MWNFRKKSLDYKDFVIYKDYKAARVISADKRGRKLYLLLSWDHLKMRGKSKEKWVKAELCKQYIPPGKKHLSQQIYGAVRLNWLQKIIIKIQNYWYESRT